MSVRVPMPETMRRRCVHCQKYRRLRQSRTDPQNKDYGEGRACARVACKPGEKCEDRPENDGDAVDALRSEAIQQPARRQLTQRIGPAESKQEISHPLRIQVQVLRHHAGRLRKGGAICKAEAANQKQNEDAEIPDSGLFGLGQNLALPSAQASALTD